MGDSSQINALGYIRDGLLNRIFWISDALDAEVGQTRSPDEILKLTLERANLRAEAVVLDGKINILNNLKDFNIMPKFNISSAQHDENINAGTPEEALTKFRAAFPGEVIVHLRNETAIVAANTRLKK